MKQGDTISAVATAFGTAGIGIIRMSGENSIAIADKVFTAMNNKSLMTAPDRSVIFGHVKDANGEIIDEAIVLIMRSPKSYTMENVVEIQCHGGVEALRAVLRRTFEAGARPAERGEFTKRAFLNGRLDLSQAQAVLDIIQAKTPTALKAAENQLLGKTSSQIKKIRREILKIVAHIEALIDFPEDDVEDIVINEIDKKIELQIEEAQEILNNQHRGKLLREGLKVAIIGKPNVGKSSLLNYLTQSERAIVTDIPGTTRDVIEEFIDFRGIPLKLIDMAGIRDTDNPIEKIGINRAVSYIEDADIIFALFDISRSFSDEDSRILDLIRNRQVLILLTKSDLPAKINTMRIKEYSKEEVIPISIKTDSGIDSIFKFISKKIEKDSLEMSFVGNERESIILSDSIKHMKEARDAIEHDLGLDFVSIDLRSALELFSKLTGESVDEDVIDEIFSKFCIGK